MRNSSLLLLFLTGWVALPCRTWCEQGKEGELDLPASVDVEEPFREEDACTTACHHYLRGDYDRALRLCDEALTKNPSDKRMKALRSDIYRALRRSDAEHHFNLQIQKDAKASDMLLDIDEAFVSAPTRDPAETIPKTTVGTLPEALVLSEEMQEKLRQRVDLNMAQAPLSEVLSALFDLTDVNILADEGLLAEKKLTIQVKGLPLRELLEYLARTFEVEFDVRGSAVWLTTPEEPSMETRIFPLTQGILFSSGRMASRTSSFSAFPSSYDFGSGGYGGGSSYSGSAYRNTSSYGSAGYADTGGFGGTGGSSFGSLDESGEDASENNMKDLDLVKALEELVEWPEGASFVVDKRTTSLLVVNTPANINKVESILLALDVAPIQVLIEARFIEVSMYAMRDLGVEWRSGWDRNRDGVISGEEASIPPLKDALGQDARFRAQSLMGLDSGFGAAGLTFKWVKLNEPELEAVLRALEQRSDTDVLSAPKVTTVNNTLATIKLVQEYTYPTDYEVETGYINTSGSDTTVNVNATVIPNQFVTREIGIILDVTPSVGSDMSTISLTLEPEVSQPADPYTFALGDYSFSVPQFSFQRVSTNMVVQNKETIVMGGLMRERITDAVTKVPFLGDVPVLGWAFKKKNKDAEKRNLLIFVTAYLLSPGGNQYEAETDGEAAGGP